MTGRPEAPAPCASPSAVENTIRRVAGAMVLISLALSIWISPLWLALAAFVGLNLFQSSFTGFCPLEMILRGRERRGTAGPAESRITTR